MTKRVHQEKKVKQTAKPPAGTICPYIDKADARCESRLSLGHLSDAFDRCICHYQNCSVFKQMSYEQSSPEKPGKLLTTCAN